MINAIQATFTFLVVTGKIALSVNLALKGFLSNNDMDIAIISNTRKI